MNFLGYKKLWSFWPFEHFLIFFHSQDPPPLHGLHSQDPPACIPKSHSRLPRGTHPTQSFIARLLRILLLLLDSDFVSRCCCSHCCTADSDLIPPTSVGHKLLAALGAEDNVDALGFTHSALRRSLGPAWGRWRTRRWWSPTWRLLCRAELRMCIISCRATAVAAVAASCPLCLRGGVLCKIRSFVWRVLEV